MLILLLFICLCAAEDGCQDIAPFGIIKSNPTLQILFLSVSFGLTVYTGNIWFLCVGLIGAKIVTENRKEHYQYQMNLNIQKCVIVKTCVYENIPREDIWFLSIEGLIRHLSPSYYTTHSNNGLLVREERCLAEYRKFVSLQIQAPELIVYRAIFSKEVLAYICLCLLFHLCSAKRLLMWFTLPWNISGGVAVEREYKI